ncbi:hypothetical protein LCGC14_3154200, partial [marine sediment metagenome]
MSKKTKADKIDKIESNPPLVDERLAPIVPLDKFRQHTIAIGGLGATGKQVLSILNTMGHPNLVGSDPDVVEEVNLCTQGWSEGDIGQHKAYILSRFTTERRSPFAGSAWRFEHFLYDMMTVKADKYMYRRGDTIIFSCVDTMRARVAIWEVVQKMMKEKRSLAVPRLFLDSRLSNGNIRIITVDLGNKDAVEFYDSTIYSDSEA